MRTLRLFDTKAGPSILLIRTLIGLVVFLPEGMQKLMFPDLLGAGRFAKIGFPWPNVLGALVGSTEIICGLLIILGLLTRLACIPLIIVMIMAIISTKIPILLGHDLGIFHVATQSRYGFWSMMHEARNDFCMLLGLIYLFIEGAGQWSIDGWLACRLKRRAKAPLLASCPADTGAGSAS